MLYPLNFFLRYNSSESSGAFLGCGVGGISGANWVIGKFPGFSNECGGGGGGGVGWLVVVCGVVVVLVGGVGWWCVGWW